MERSGSLHSKRRSRGEENNIVLKFILLYISKSRDRVPSFPHRHLHTIDVCLCVCVCMVFYILRWQFFIHVNAVVFSHLLAFALLRKLLSFVRHLLSKQNTLHWRNTCHWQANQWHLPVASTIVRQIWQHISVWCKNILNRKYICALNNIPNNTTLWLKYIRTICTRTWEEEKTKSLLSYMKWVNIYFVDTHNILITLSLSVWLQHPDSFVWIHFQPQTFMHLWTQW